MAASDTLRLLRRAFKADDAALQPLMPSLEPLLGHAALSPVKEERQLAIALSSRLPPASISTPLIAALATGLARRNRSWFEKLVDTLPESLIEAVVGGVEAAMANKGDVEALAPLLVGLTAAKRFAVAIGTSTQLFLSLCDIYDADMPSSIPRTAQWAIPLRPELNRYLRARLEVVEAVEAALSKAYLDTKDLSSLSSLLMSAFDLPSAPSHPSAAISLVSLSLLGDLEALFGFSGQLKALGDADDAALEYVMLSLQRLVPAGRQSGLDLLLVEAPSIEAKVGKGKAKVVTNGVETIKQDIAEAIAHVRAVLPDQDPAFLRRALSHPSYPSPESLITAILENTLPAELRSAAPPPRSALADVRANVFEDRLDPTQALNRHPPTIKLDKAIDEELRASILAFAEMDAAQEHEVELDDYDADEAPAPARLRDEGEVEDVDGGAEEDDNAPAEGDVRSRPRTPQPGSGFSPAVSRALEKAYLTDKTVFESTSRARSMKERKVLEGETGLAGDLIESWAKMLERDPNKDRILGRHATVFQGNERGQTVASGSSNDRGRGRGRGGGGGDRGGRGGRGRGRSDHIRRQRGHDRKVRAVGGPG